MPHPIKFLVRDDGWIHTGLGLIGNVLFFAGSILFLPTFSDWKTIAVWLFITGSFLMLLGTLGDLIVAICKKKE